MRKASILRVNPGLFSNFNGVEFYVMETNYYQHNIKKLVAVTVYMDYLICNNSSITFHALVFSQLGRQILLSNSRWDHILAKSGTCSVQMLPR